MGSHRIFSLFCTALLLTSSAIVYLDLAPSASGATIIGPGNLASGAHWTAAGSPYYVEGNITVARGRALTIDPGVLVKFNGTYWMNVNGTLLSEGAPGNEITFTSNHTSPSKGNWTGIRFRFSNNNIINHTIIQYAETGMSFYNSHNNEISNSNISFNNNNGIFADGVLNNSIMNNEFYSNTGSGADLNSGSNVTIESNRFQNSTVYGLYATGLQGSKISHNSFYTVIEGIHLQQSSANTIDWNTIGFPRSGDTAGMILTAACNSNEIFNNSVSRYTTGMVLQVGSNANDIRYNTLERGTTGLRLSASGNNFIYHNTARIYSGRGMSLESRSTDNTILSNQILDNAFGLALEGVSSTNLIESNTFRLNDDAAIDIGGASNQVDILRNTIKDNNIGIQATDGVGLRIEGNTISSNDGNGINFQRVTNSDIVGNRIEGNSQDGISLQTSVGSTLIENILENNNRGIFATASTGNDIYHNNFLRNNPQAQETAGANNWDNGYPSGGNYWNDYDGTDERNGAIQLQAGGDGIGDTPYIIPTLAWDQYPLMDPYGDLVPCNGIHITSSITWTTSQSPKDVKCNTYVKKGVTLTIQAGVEVRFAGRYGLYVDGTILSQGTSGNLAVFTSNQTVPEQGSWSGIKINSTGRGEFDYTNISYATAGLIFESGGNFIRNSILTINEDAIHIYNTMNNTVENNNISKNGGGLYIQNSQNNTITGNDFSSNFDYSLLVDGKAQWDFVHTIPTSNTVNSKQIRYYYNLDGQTISPVDAGHITVAWSRNVMVEYVTIIKGDPIRFVHTDNSEIRANEVRGGGAIAGIQLVSSDNNVVFDNRVEDRANGIFVKDSSQNNITTNVLQNMYSSTINMFYTGDGISSTNSHDNTYFSNNMTGQIENGFHMSSTWNDRIITNLVPNGNAGILAAGMADTEIALNYFYQNAFGISLPSNASGLDIHHNSFILNAMGVSVLDSNIGAIHRNNFIDNTLQAEDVGSGTTWDDGQRGNYWSEYTGSDDNNDGVGDTSYDVDENTQDRYPLMESLNLPGGVDTQVPNRIIDLSVVGNTSTTMDLQWTAPGDDDNGGTADHYLVRHNRLGPILTENAWDSATEYVQDWEPLPSGATERYRVAGLEENLIGYWFSVRAVDEAGNMAPISNSPLGHTQIFDVSPPRRIDDLEAVLPRRSTVTLRWTATGDDFLDNQLTGGIAHHYDVKYRATTPITTQEHWDNSTTFVQGWVPKEIGESESDTVSGLLAEVLYCFAIRAVDEAGNEGAIFRFAGTETCAKTTTAGGVQNVEKAKTYNNIQDAIDDARDNAWHTDTISVGESTYFEDLLIDIPLKIVGENLWNTTIRGSVAVLNTHDVTLSTFKITEDIEISNAYNTTFEYLDMETGYLAFDILDCQDILLRTINMHQYGYGVRITGSTRVRIEDSNFNEIAEDAIEVNGYSKYFYDHEIDNTNTVDGNPVYYYYEQTSRIIQDTKVGHLTIAYSNDITVLNANFTHDDTTIIGTTNSQFREWNLTGGPRITVTKSDWNTFEHINITDPTGTGIRASECHNNTFANINITGGNSYGIFLIDSHDNTFDSIFAYRLIGHVGFRLERSGNANITNLVVKECGIGLSVLYTQSDITLPSGGLILRNSHFISNSRYGLSISGDLKVNFDNDINTSNTVNGNPIYYIFDQNGVVLENMVAGHVSVVYSSNAVIRNMTLDNGDGVYLNGCDSCTIRDIHGSAGYRLRVYASSDSIFRNLSITNAANLIISASNRMTIENVVMTGGSRIVVFSTDSLTVSNVTVTGSDMAGIHLEKTPGAEVRNVLVTGSYTDGINLVESAQVRFFNITTIGNNRGAGLKLRDSTANTVVGLMSQSDKYGVLSISSFHPLYPGATNPIINSTILASTSRSAVAAEGTILLLQNTSYTSPIEAGSGGSYIDVQWFVDVHVQRLDGSPVVGAAVAIVDLNDDVNSAAPTRQDGWAYMLIATQFRIIPSYKEMRTPNNVSAVMEGQIAFETLPILSNTQIVLVLDVLPRTVHNTVRGVDYLVIQAAIDDARAHGWVGDTILVDAGTYPENLLIDIPITIIGHDRAGTIIDGQNAASSVTFNQVSQATLSGFSVINGNPANIDAAYVSEVTVNDCLLQSAATSGLDLASSSLTLSNSSVSGSAANDFYMDGASSAYAINSSFNQGMASFQDASSTVYVQWFVDVFVRNQEDTPISGAEVEVLDNGAAVVASGLTDFGGYLKWQPITERRLTQAGTTILTPHTVTAEREAVFNTTGPVTIDYSQVVVVTLDIVIPPILVVDDDDSSGYQTYYTGSLDALGLEYDVWSVSASGSPSHIHLQGYSRVIWLTGNDRLATLTDTDQSNLASYLDAGGRLLLSGQDIGFELGNSNMFYTNYLRAEYLEDDSDLTQLSGTPGDPIGNGLTVRLENSIIGDDGADNQAWPSIIAPREGANTVFKYSGTSSSGAIKVDSGVYKAVYFAFGFEGIADSETRDSVLQRVLDWLELPSVGPNPVFNIDRGTHHPTIQDAVDRAVAGDTLEAAIGVYWENILIGKDITLRGPSRQSTTIWGADGSQEVITITGGSRLDLSGFTLRNGSAGLAISGSPYIHDLEVNGTANGMSISDGSEPTVVDTLIADVAVYGVFAGGDTTKPVFRNVTIRDAGRAIKLDGGSVNFLFENSSIENSTQDIELGFGNHRMYVINSSITDSKVSVSPGEGGQVHVMWYMDVLVKDNVSNHLQNIRVAVNDSLGDTIHTDFTDVDGMLRHVQVTEFIQDGNGKNPQTPHMVTAYRKGITGENITTMDANKLVVVLIDVNATPLGRVYNVEQDEYYANITFAVAVANPNETLRLGSQVYEENITIDKRLTIIGVDTATVVIDGMGAPFVVNVTGVSYVNISGLTLTNATEGLTVTDSPFLVLAHTSITSVNVTALNISGSRNVTAAHVTVSGAEAGILSNSQVAHRYLYNTIEGVDSGIIVADGTNYTVMGNHITSTGPAVTFSGGQGHNITGNTLIAGNGLYVYSSASQISSNFITVVAAATGAYGIMLSGDNFTVDSNTVDITGAEATGIWLDGALDSNVTENMVTVTGINSRGIVVNPSLNILLHTNNVDISGVGSYGVSILSSSLVSIGFISVTGGDYGFYLKDSTEITCEACAADGTMSGYFLSNSSKNRFFDADIIDSDYGLTVRDGSSNNTFYGLEITALSYGANITEGTGNRINDSSFSQASGYGISLYNTVLVELESLSLTSNGAFGIRAAGVVGANISRNTITDHVRGLVVAPGSTNISVKNNTIADSLDNGIYLQGDILNPLSSLVLFNNTIIDTTGYGYAISLAYVLDSVIESNTMSGKYMGIALSRSTTNTILNNTVTGNMYGIYLSSMSQENTITGNTISQSGVKGVFISQSNKNTLSENIIESNTIGVEVFVSNNITIQGCLLSQNVEAVQLRESAEATLANSTLSGSRYMDATARNSSTLTVLNTPIDSEMMYAHDSQSLLKVQWYLQVEVKNGEGEPIPFSRVIINGTQIYSYNVSEGGINVTYNVTYGSVSYDGISNVSGIALVPTTQYIVNDTGRVNYTPCNISVEKYGYTSYTLLNFTQNTVVVLTLDRYYPTVDGVDIMPSPVLRNKTVYFAINASSEDTPEDMLQIEMAYQGPNGTWLNLTPVYVGSAPAGYWYANFTPNFTADIGDHNLSVRFFDNDNVSSPLNITIFQISNNLPIIGIDTMVAPLPVDEELSVTINLTGNKSDLEDDESLLGWYVAAIDPPSGGLWAVLGENSTNDTLTILPPPDFSGQATVTLALVDSDGGVSTYDMVFEWLPTNDAPRVTSPVELILLPEHDYANLELKGVEYKDIFTDPDGDDMTYTITSNGRVNLQDDGTTLWISAPDGYYPPGSDPNFDGEEYVNITATDHPSNESTSYILIVKIDPSNDAPSVAKGSGLFQVNVVEETPLYFDLKALHIFDVKLATIFEFGINLTSMETLVDGEPINETLRQIFGDNNVNVSASADVYNITDTYWKVVDGSDVYLIHNNGTNLTVSTVDYPRTSYVPIMLSDGFSEGLMYLSDEIEITQTNETTWILVDGDLKYTLKDIGGGVAVYMPIFSDPDDKMFDAYNGTFNYTFFSQTTSILNITINSTTDMALITSPVNTSGMMTVIFYAADRAMEEADQPHLNFTLTFNITNVNDPPAKIGQLGTLYMTEGSLDYSSINLYDIFEDSDDYYLSFDVTITSTSGFSNGIVPPTGSGVSVITDSIGGIVQLSTPSDWFGTVEVLFHARDGHPGTPDITENLTLVVTPLNDAPRIVYPLTLDDFTVQEDSTDMSINLSRIFWDVDNFVVVDPSGNFNGDYLGFSYTNLGAGHITVEITEEGMVTLTPDADWVGMERILFWASDGELDSAVYGVNVTIAQVNDIPHLLQRFASIDIPEDGSESLNLNDYFDDIEDEKNPEFTVSVLSNAGNVSAEILSTGLLVISSKTENWTGSVQLRVIATDSDGAQKAGNVFLAVFYPVNDAPGWIMAVPMVVLPEDGQNLNVFNLKDYVYDSDSPVTNITFSVKTQTYEHMSAHVGITGFLSVYAETPDYVGITEFIISVSDGINSLDISFIAQTTPVNDPPVSVIDFPTSGLEMLTGQLYTFQSGSYDLDNATFELFWNFGDGHYSSEVSPSYIYLEPSDGQYEVRLTVTDSTGAEAIISVYVYVIMDTDGDGIGDPDDPNIDNDIAPNDVDAFPYDPSEWLDTDNDGTGNNEDLNDDNDPRPDATDLYPLDPTRWSDAEAGDGMDYLMLLLLVVILLVVVILGAAGIRTMRKLNSGVVDVEPSYQTVVVRKPPTPREVKPEMLVVKCPKCQENFDVKPDAEKLKCPHCGVSGRM